MSRVGINPVSRDEYERLTRAIDSWIDGWGPVEPAKREDFRTILETLWWVGCHPTVLCPRNGVEPPPLPRIVSEAGKATLVYQRAKTGRILKARLPENLVGGLTVYLDAGRPRKYHQLKTAFEQLNKIAGLDPPVTALRFRHRVGLEVTKRQGPGVAQRVLGVSDRVLKHYTTLSDDKAFDAAFEALGGD